MRDIPIIFSAPMVCALLDGRKSQTRRLARAARRLTETSGPGYYRSRCIITDSSWTKVKPGDRLWVRENFRWRSWSEDGCFWISYEADGARSKCLTPPDGDQSQNLMEKLSARLDRAGVPCDDNGYQSTDALGITPCIHMPRWASRLTLVVGYVRIERLQAISNGDAFMEGQPDSSANSPRIWFSTLWRSLHGDASWDANPEVVAITFTVHKQNIDVLPKAAAA